MSKFAHLQELKVKPDAAAEYRPLWLPGATFTLRPALDENEAYFKEDVADDSGADKITAMALETDKPKRLKLFREHLDAKRTFDRKVFPATIFVGWENVPDSNGTPVTFSVDEAQELVNAIPDREFDELRTFCRNIENFRKIPNAANIVKNS